MKKLTFIKIIIIIMVFLLVLCSCIRIPANYTETGIKNYIESEKKIRKERVQYRKFQKKQKIKIYKMQQQKIVACKN